MQLIVRNILATFLISLILFSCQEKPKSLEDLQLIKLVDINRNETTLGSYLSKLNKDVPTIFVILKSVDGLPKLCDSLSLLKQKESFNLISMYSDSIVDFELMDIQLEQLSKRQRVFQQFDYPIVFNTDGEFSKYFDLDSDMIYYLVFQGNTLLYKKASNSYFTWEVDFEVLKTLLASKGKLIQESYESKNTVNKYVFNYGFNDYLATGDWSYTKNDTTVFSGSYDEKGKEDGPWKMYYYSDGSLYVDATFEHGKQQGDYTVYNDSGAVIKKYHYIDDKKEGLWEEYFKENGAIKKLSNYKDDKLNGEYKVYYKDGQISTLGAYLDDEKNGYWKTFYEDGKVYDEGNYTNGEPDGEWKTYYDNGQLAKLKLWNNGKLVDVYASYDYNGKNIPKGTIANGNGTLISYDNDGDVNDIRMFVDGNEVDDYYDDLLKKDKFETFTSVKTPELTLTTSSTYLKFKSYVIKDYAKLSHNQYVMGIPFDVPESGFFGLIMFNQPGWSVLNGEMINRAMYFNTLKNKKSFSASVDGSKIDVRKDLLFTFQQGENFYIDKLKGEKAYLYFPIDKDNYSKYKDRKVYVALKHFENQKEVDDWFESFKKHAGLYKD